MSQKFWALALNKAIKDPQNIVKQDDLVVVIKDKFPKAKHHYLIIPKEEINTIFELNSSHVTLLKHMEDVADILMEKLDVEYKKGYHAQPSMLRLHMHCISEDMISDSLKTKKHWNSFTTEFFINSEDLINQIKNDGKVTRWSEEKCKEILSRPLKCHICLLPFKDMPKLKNHLHSHQS